MTCAYDHTVIVSGQRIVVCPNCQTPYHEDCWIENGNQCSILGCPGSGQPQAQIYKKNGEGILNHIFHLRRINIRRHWRIIRLPSWMMAVIKGILRGFSGAAVWFILIYQTFEVLSNWIVLPARIWFLIPATIVGIWLGIVYFDREQLRLIYVLAGWIVFNMLGRMIYGILSLEATATINPQTINLSLLQIIGGMIGSWLGAFSNKARPTLLRVGMTTILAWYVIRMINILAYPSYILTLEFKLLSRPL